MLELKQAGRNIDVITLTTLPDLSSLGGASYLFGLLSYADVENFDSTEKLILDLWKEREKRNILSLASLQDWEISKVILCQESRHRFLPCYRLVTSIKKFKI
jgi:replicative DNA helicase